MKKFWLTSFLCLTCTFCTVGFTGCNNCDKQFYTQTIPVIFVIKTDYGTTVSNINSSRNYLDTAVCIIRSSDTIEKADEIYLQTYEKYNYDMQQYNEYGGIKANSIDIIRGGETVLIISYKDYNSTVASKKLDAFIQAAQIILQQYLSDYETAELIPITTEYYCNL